MSSRKEKRFAFPAKYRIRKRSEILELQTHGRKLYSKHFLVIARASQTGQSRLAVTVSKKVDKRAVVRNHIKRRLRELFRLNRYLLKEAFDILVIARKNAVDVSYFDTRREILGALYHNGFLVKHN